MAHWTGVQGRVKVARKTQNLPIVTSPLENAKSKTKKNYFRFQLEDSLNP